MVLAFNPASRATSTKLAPTEVLGFSEAKAAAGDPCAGLASARTCSSGSTNAVRLRDLMNARREEDKREIPSRVWIVLECDATFIVNGLRLLQVWDVALTDANHQFFPAQSMEFGP